MMGRELFKQNMEKKLAKKPEIIEKRAYSVPGHRCQLKV